MKKLLVALVLMVAMLATCLVGCNIVPDPNTNGEDLNAAKAAAVFTLDVNPGVRIYVKEDNTVIAVEATNKDGEGLVAELEIDGESYEAVVEEIIDVMEENGYLEGEENSILISVEKKTIDISEKVNKKIDEAFKKHGKKASVIEQELDELDEKIGKEIGDMAEKYHISKGKAHLIEKIREEFPELSEEELATLRVNDLGMMLEDTSDDIKEHFNKIGEAVDNAYVGREKALESALESLENAEITLENIEMPRVHADYEDGKMLYEVEFVYDGMCYEIEVDAVTGEVLSTECEEFVEFDAKEMIDEFCGKHNIHPEDFHDHFNGFFGDHDDKHHDDDHNEQPPADKALTKGELLKGILAGLNISEESLKKTDVKMYETECGTVFRVMIETDEGNIYTIVVEAFSGAVIRSELNDTEIKMSVEDVD